MNSRLVIAFPWLLAKWLIFMLAVSASPVIAQADLQEEFESLRLLVQKQQATIDQLEEQVSVQSANQALPAPATGESGTRDAASDAYDGGFLILGEGSNQETFRLRIGSWGQLRHNYFDSTGPNRDQNDLEFERLRLVFDGYAFNPSFRYFFQLDADSDANEVVDMLDYYVTYDLGHDMFCRDEGRIQIRFGKWKIGFNRAREESGTRMQFSDRSMASVLFDFDRSIGIGLLGTIDSGLGPLDWQVTLADGIDTGGFRPSRAGDLDRNFAVATRINWLLSGDWGNDGHADLDWRRTPAIRLGTGFTYTRPDVEGFREFAFPRVVDSGANLDTVLPLGVTSYDLFLHCVDLNLKYRGFSGIFEYYFRQFTDFRGGTLPSLLDHGYWAEVGYFLKPEHLQFIARHSRIVGDSGTLGSIDQSADEWAAGFVIYAMRHRLKLTFDLTHLNGAPVNDSALNIRPGDAGWLYRTQLQWKF